MHAPDDLLAKLLKAWHFLYKRGFIEGFGHISARIPDSELFLLARHSLGPRANAEDFLVVDLQGRKVSGKGDMPGEYPIHLEILKARPDIGSVVHYHGLHSTAFTTSEHQLRAIHLMGTLFHDGIPTYDDPRLVTNADRGTALAQALGPHRAVLLRAHGAAITGATVEECVGGTFLFEENARRAHAAASMGKPVWIDNKLAAAAGGELLKSRGPFKRVWALVESDSEPMNE
ncbi:MAG: class II aldolase/adducin family protein [Burkholderiales bacterium]|nr:class II aldolase/adducin family protein [Burkholderiales bacterium]